MSNTCKNCVFWINSYQTCHCTKVGKITRGAKRFDVHVDTCADEDYEERSYLLETGPDFGCVLFAAKDAPKQS